MAEGGKEIWLSVDLSAKADVVAKAIVNAMERAAGDAAAHSSDESLRDDWFQGLSPGLVDMQRLLYLAILVKSIGPFERLGGVVADLRGKVAGTIHEVLIEQELARAGVHA